MKSHKELLEEFLFFEEEKNLFEWEINSIPIWELIRTMVFTELSSKLVNKSVVERNDKNGSRIKLFFTIIYNLIFYNPFFSFKKKEVIILNHPRRKLDKGFYEDIYIDNLLPSLDNNFIMLEGFVSHNTAHLKPVKSKNLFYLDVIQFTSNIISKKLSNKLNSSSLDEIKNLEFEFFKFWGVDLEVLKKEVPVLLTKWKVSKKLITKLIDNIKPKIVVNVVSYSFINQVFNFIAKEKNIPVIELQHGTVGRYHINYNYKNYKQRRLKTFPNYFLSWGKNWVKNSRLPLSEKNIISTGYPYINRFRNEKKYKRNLKQLVFISQVREDIACFTEEVAKLLPDFQIIFKAHPAEYPFAEKKYSSIMTSKNIKIVCDDQINLYTLFQESFAVFGVHSTALIEALAFCPKVGIIKLSGWEYFEDIEETDNIIFIDNQKTLKEYVLKENICSIRNFGDEYFEKKSQEKILNFFNKFL